MLKHIQLYLTVLDCVQILPLLFRNILYTSYRYKQAEVMLKAVENQAKYYCPERSSSHLKWINVHLVYEIYIKKNNNLD